LSPGKSKNAAKSALEKLDLANLTAKEAVKEVAKILYMQHDPAKVCIEMWCWVRDREMCMYVCVCIYIYVCIYV